MIWLLSQKKWACDGRDRTRDIWTASNRHAGEHTTPSTPLYIWLHISQPHPWTLQTQNKELVIHPRHRWFWCQVFLACQPRPREQHPLKNTLQQAMSSAHYTVDSPWNGIINCNTSIFPFQNYWIYPLHSNCSTPHMPTLIPNMGQESSILRLLTHHHVYPQSKLRPSKKS